MDDLWIPAKDEHFIRLIQPRTQNTSAKSWQFYHLTRTFFEADAPSVLRDAGNALRLDIENRPIALTHRFGEGERTRPQAGGNGADDGQAA